MKNLTLILFLVLISFFLKAQTSSLSWVKSFGSGIGGNEYPTQTIVDNSGNTIVVGYYENVVDFDPSSNVENVVSKGIFDGFIAKYNSSGGLIWVKSIGGSSDDRINTVGIDNNNNILIAGSFSGTADFDPSTVIANIVSNGAEDIFFAKYDPNGNYIWSKSIGGTAQDVAQSLEVDSNGNIFIAGFVSTSIDFDPSPTFAINGNGCFFAKYDNNGIYQFAKRLTSQGQTNSIFIDNSGNVYVAGRNESSVVYFTGISTNVNYQGPGIGDVFVAKYTNSGNNVWYKTLGSTGFDVANEVSVDGLGNVYVLGLFQNTVDFDPSSAVVNLTTTGQDIFLLKLNNLGNYVWVNSMGGPGNKGASSIAIDSNNDVYISGMSRSGVDFDPSASTATINTNSFAAFLTKYDSNGGYIWLIGLDGGGASSAANFGSSISKKANGNIVLTGYFHDTTDFDPSLVVQSLISRTANSVFIAEYTPSGTYVNAVSTNDPSMPNEVITDIVSDHFGHIYSAGYFSGTIDFDQGPGAMTIIADTVGDGFLIKQDTSGNVIWAKNVGVSSLVKIYTLTTDVSGNVYVVGRYLVNSISSIFIAKYDANGNTIWEKIMGGSTVDYARTVSINNAGDIVISGHFQGNVDFDPSGGTAYLLSSATGANDNVFIAKYDINGNYLMAKALDIDNLTLDCKVDGNNNIYIFGNYTGTARLDPLTTIVSFTTSSWGDFLAKYDPSGMFIWSKSSGNIANTAFHSVEIDNLNNLYLSENFSGTLSFVSASAVTTTVSSSNGPMCLSKFDSNGNNIWVKSMGSQSTTYLHDMCLDANSNIFITGSFWSTTNFDTLSSASTITSSGQSNIFLTEFDSNGNFLWTKSMGNNQYDDSYSVCRDANNDIYIGGRYNMTVDFDPSLSVSNQSSLGGDEAFVAKYRACAQPFLPVNSSLPNNLSVCTGQTTTLTASGSGTMYWYNTAFGGVSLYSGNSFTTNIIAADTFFVEGRTCAASLNRTPIALTVMPLPIITINTNTVCVGSSTTFSATGANTYSWSTGATSSVLNVIPLTGATYSVIGTDLNNCQNTQTVAANFNNTCQDVWPGDANSDGLADNLDVLELGLHYTQTGTPRSSISNIWQSYFSNNWTGTISNGKNLNHSDCNGDGTIDDNDTLAIYNNYSLTHAFKPVQTNTVNPQLTIVPDQASVLKGTWGTTSIYLGDATTNINNINGVAFTVDFDNTLIEANNIYIEYQNSFIDASQNLHFRKLDFANGKIYTATTHTINNNVSGYGKIATLHYQIKSTLTSAQVLNLGVSQANQSNALGIISPLTSGAGSLTATIDVGLEEYLNSSLISIHPNPTNGSLAINSKNTLQKIEVVSMTGQTLLTETPANVSHTLHLDIFSNGIYFVNVYQNNRIVKREKIVLSK